MSVERNVYQTSQGGKVFVPLEDKARIIRCATPRFARMLSSTYARLNASDVCDDLLNNHGREISRGEEKQLLLIAERITLEDEGEAQSRERAFAYVVNSHLHMMSNRLGVSPFHECAIADCIARSLEGRIVASGSAESLKASVGKNNVTLDDVFVKLYEEDR